MPGADYGMFLLVGLLWYPVFVLSMLVYRAGRTMGSRLEGQYEPFDFRPLALIQREWIGMVLVPIITYLLPPHFLFGWSSTMFDPDMAYSDPRRSSRKALSGPLALVSVTIWTTVVMRICLYFGWLSFAGAPMTAIVLSPTATTNILTILLSLLWSNNLLFAAFYLMPIPPLDGAQVFGFFMPLPLARKWQTLLPPNMQYQLLCILLAVLLFPFFWGPIQGLALYLGFPH